MVQSTNLNKNIEHFSNNEWSKKIRECQERIVELSKNEYYAKAYKDEELSYWLHVARWIYQDSKKRTSRTSRTCLDIGCAYGTLSLYHKLLNNSQIYCIDFMDFLSKELMKEYDYKYSICNIELESLPWEMKFDNIIFTEVLEHLNFNALPTLIKIKDLLDKNGRIYLSTPDAAEWGRVTKYYDSYEKMPYPQKNMPIVDDHVYQFSKEELLTLIDDAGLKVERFEYAPGVVHRHFNLTLVKKKRFLFFGSQEDTYAHYQ
jgi:SAM-dependent methyltransferase